MSPPCTILLRINGGFERISDATVIENGDHLHYEKPVGSVIVLEETTHKVLYIMNKEDICSSDPEPSGVDVDDDLHTPSILQTLNA